MVDVTELKHFLFKVNMHRTNPPLFKMISDISRHSDYKATWTFDEMQAFFLSNSCLNLADLHTPPSIDQLVSLFESLDTNMKGFLTLRDVRVFMENFFIFKRANRLGP